MSIFQQDTFVTYIATLAFTGRLVGGAPSDPDLVEGWLAKNAGITDKEQLQRWRDKHLSEVLGIDPTTATADDIEAAMAANAIEKKANVFKRTPEGKPYIEGRQVKAMLKEAVSIAYPRGEHKFGAYKGKSGMVGGKNAESYLAERVHVPERPIVVADEVSGVDLAVQHIKDWKGDTRSALSYFEYIDQPTVSVTVHVLDDCLTAEQWARIWQVAELNGLGARRSQGAGQFQVTGWTTTALSRLAKTAA